jgi:HlyD family secretion protein
MFTWINKSKPRRNLIFVGIGFMVLALGSMMLRNEDDQSIFCTSKQGLFEIKVTVTGELQAERSEIIMAPSQLRNPMFGFSNLKIQDLVPEGTIVDSGDYVGMLDRTESANRLKDIAEEIRKIEADIRKSHLDSAIGLYEAREAISELQIQVEEKKIAFSQLKYEPPASIRVAEREVEKALKDITKQKKNYQLKEQQYLGSIQSVESQLAQSKRRQEELIKILDDFEIRASKHGMIIYYREWGGQKRKVGSTITPWDLNVATLPDMSSMISRTYVNEIEISKIQLGLKVLVSLDAFPDKKYAGEVISVANVGEVVPNSSAKAFEVFIRLTEQSPAMRPGMTTSNEIIINSFSDKVFVPIDAVDVVDSKTYVYTRSGIKQEIATGLSNNNFIIVERGLKPDLELHMNRPSKTERFKVRNIEI